MSETKKTVVSDRDWASARYARCASLCEAGGGYFLCTVFSITWFVQCTSPKEATDVTPRKFVFVGLATNTIQHNSANHFVQTRTLPKQAQPRRHPQNPPLTKASRVCAMACCCAYAVQIEPLIVLAAPRCTYSIFYKVNLPRHSLSSLTSTTW